jgi:DNA-binding transcriptional regulator YiaG
MPPTPTNLSLEEILLLSEVRHLTASGQARRIRESAGVSQAEIGAVIGVTVPAVSKWETGDRCPTGAGALRYARLLRALAQHNNRPDRR